MPTMMDEHEDESHETFNNKEILRTFDGKVVQMNGGTLLMANAEGKNSFHTLAYDAKVTCDGAVCNAGDLKPGNKIRITVNTNLNMAIKIEALDQGSGFSQWFYTSHGLK